MSYEDEAGNIYEDMVPSPDYAPAHPIVSCVGHGIEAFLWIGDDDGEIVFAILAPEEFRAYLKRIIPRVFPGMYLARRKKRARRKK